MFRLIGFVVVSFFALIILMAVVGIATSTKSPAAPDLAAKPEAVKPAKVEQPELTYAKYQEIKTGMTYDEVHKIIGFHGEEMSRTAIADTETVMIHWEAGFGSNMNAMFQNGKVVNKAQFGLN